MSEIHIIFDRMPCASLSQFIEVEDENGQSFKAGEWVERDDGTWALVMKQDARIAELEGIITEAIPFIGYEAHVPDLVRRAEDAVGYGAEEGSGDG